MTAEGGVVRRAEALEGHRVTTIGEPRPPWPANAEFTSEGLYIAGVPAQVLAAEYETPLFVVDADDFRQRCRRFREAFPHALYAVKAFPTRGLIRIADEEGLGFLAASGGELNACLRAGVDARKIALHGNNKSDDEILAALEAGVGWVICDALWDITRVGAAASARGRSQAILLRVNPDVQADTHHFIRTGHAGSKFGTSIRSGAALRAVAVATRTAGIDFRGLQAHIGSQIFNTIHFLQEVDALVGFAAQVKNELNLEIKELDVGGGFAATYAGESPPMFGDYAKAILRQVKARVEERGLQSLEVIAESGRALAANSVLTLYRVGSMKPLPGGTICAAVDGGMSDNLRPMLYGAKYTVALGWPSKGGSMASFTVVGKHCESADVLATDVRLPATLSSGDLVAFAATGAYGYAMASNYNKIGRPAVVAVKDGLSELWVRRETDEDLDRLEVG
ncbi:MAG: diaminopimelate decarboxylase [Actinomycetota bacterium]|nr:diaminopimelate decarboxylase [Actinomycetota bacterium]